MFICILTVMCVVNKMVIIYCEYLLKRMRIADKDIWSWCRQICKSANKVRMAQRNMERAMLSSRRDKMRNADISHKIELTDIIGRIAQTKWTWAGLVGCRTISGLRRFWNGDSGRNKSRQSVRQTEDRRPANNWIIKKTIKRDKSKSSKQRRVEKAYVQKWT